MPEVTRRAVLGSGAAGIGLVALAACGSSGGSGDDTVAAGAAGVNSGTTSGAATGTGNGSGSGTSTSAAAASGGTALIKLADVPVGGSASGQAKVNGQPCVVSQRTAGAVTAFSAICTHQGCTVQPAGAEFHCPCHGSKYNAFTGAVIQGPAPRPLTAIPVTVEAGEVTASA